MITCDHRRWSSYMIILIYDGHLRSSYMIISYDHHIWSSYMIIIYDHHMGVSILYMQLISPIVERKRERGRERSLLVLRQSIAYCLLPVFKNFEIAIHEKVLKNMFVLNNWVPIRSFWPSVSLEACFMLCFHDPRCRNLCFRTMFKGFLFYCHFEHGWSQLFTWRLRGKFMKARCVNANVVCMRL